MKMLLKTMCGPVVALAAALCLPGMASAEPFSQLVAFSGALTDTGNYASVHGDYPAPFYKNRTTNGPVAVDILARQLGLAAEPSMHLKGQVGGTNFAVADALAGGQGPDDLPAQVSAYLARNGGKADPKALHFLFIGGNDVVLAVMTPDDAKSDKLLNDAVDGIETAIHTLVAAGAKTIFAPDFIDISPAPGVQKAGLGAAQRASKLSHEYNRRFDAMLDRVEKEGGFTLIRWRFSDFVEGLIAHGDEFRFTNVKDSCQAQPAGQCDYDRFVFFNDEYPTARVHELVGTAMAIAVLERDAAAPAPQQKASSN